MCTEFFIPIAFMNEISSNHLCYITFQREAFVLSLTIMDHVYTQVVQKCHRIFLYSIEANSILLDHNLYYGINIKTKTEYEFEDEFNH
jgi:hypothetical protein